MVFSTPLYLFLSLSKQPLSAHTASGVRGDGVAKGSAHVCPDVRAMSALAWARFAAPSSSIVCTFELHLRVGAELRDDIVPRSNSRRLRAPVAA